MVRLLAIAVLLGGCFTMRAGAGLTVDSNGAVAPQLTVAFGFTGGEGGAAAVGRVGLGETTTRSQAVAWHRHVLPHGNRSDDLPESLLRFDLRLGMHEKWVDHPDRAFLFGGGAAYLWVRGGKQGCLYHGIGDQTRHAVGVEATLDGIAGGDPTLPRGIVSIGAVYQIDWYLRSSDCGS